MCYAIPGKVISIDSKTVTMDYFGEARKAIFVTGSYEVGDYVYAQGGIVVSKLSEEDAIPILKMWEKQFFELKARDAILSEQSKFESPISPIIQRAEKDETLSRNEMLAILSVEGKDLELLFQGANRIRKNKLDNACCVHGILEFSNYCQNNCLYCGIRSGNANIKRYRMNETQILEAVDHSVSLGFKALVLQSGEDPFYSDEMLIALVKKIREKHGILLFMSIGERSKVCYKKLFDAGAYGALLRFETSNDLLYEKMRPGRKRIDRINLIRDLIEIGFIVATGFLIGLPGQSKDDLINDILLTKSLKPDMYSFGPLIPHPETPLSSIQTPSLDDALKAIALTRLVDPESKILVTSALETLSPDAKKKGLMAGGNSLMINTTPKECSTSYDLYPGKSTETPVPETIKNTIELLYSLGRAPTDLGVTNDR
ncbi:MAG: [FeFe] hydrogenase H-cluster radical SAM maturase HydE [Candidatus Micrarchaeota archaeon]